MNQRLSCVSALFLLVAPVLAQAGVPKDRLVEDTLVTYVSGADGYTISIPANWSIHEDRAAGFSVAAVSPCDRYKVSVVIEPGTVHGVRHGHKHRAETDAFIQMLEEQAPSVQVEVLETGQRDLSGYPSTYRKLKLTYPGSMLQDVVLVQYSLLRGNRSYTLTATVDDATRQAVEPLLNDLLASFRFRARSN